MPGSSASSVQRHRLRDILRRAREAAELTQDNVAAAMEWSQSKVIRIESGTVRISVTDLRALLNLYSITDPERVNELVELARGARRRTWVTPYRRILSAGFATYAELEANALQIRYFTPTIVPGIAQTRAYATATTTELTDDRSNVPAMVAVRLRRQQALFERPDPPSIVMILDEAVLRREVGGRVVMAEQLHHLLSLAALPHVQILIIPFTVGAYAGIFGPFLIMDFPDPSDKPLLYHEGPAGDTLVRDREDLIATYRETIDHLVATALSESDSLAFIKQVSAELE